MENHVFYEEIGHGSFSTVYKGRTKRTVEFVGIRRIERAHHSKAYTEVQALHSLDHANVLKFHAWFATTNHVWVVTEYCAGGDLDTLIRQDGNLPEVTVLSFGLDVIAALIYVHSRGILAVDLRPPTLYISEYGILKLADLGCACSIERPHGWDGQPFEAQERLVAMSTRAPSYVAPELLARAGSHTLGSDCWAFGALLHEMAIGHPPFAPRNRAPEEVAHAVATKPAHPLPRNSETLNDLLRNMLAKNPAARPSWPVLTDHSFWRGVAPRAAGHQQCHQQHPRHSQHFSRSAPKGWCDGGEEPVSTVSEVPPPSWDGSTPPWDGPPP